VESPEEVVKVGDEVEVKILRVDAADRKIGLSRRQSAEAAREDDGGGSRAAERGPRQRELRGGTGAGGGQLFGMPQTPEKGQAAAGATGPE
jgi:small subunit ribosomal protein S1